MEKQEICYLCGLEIDQSLDEAHPDSYSEDHIPPQVFYPSELRGEFAKENRFPTLPAHKKCNNSFGDDETYFVRVFTTMIGDKNELGEALFKDFERHAKHPQHAKVLKKIMTGIRDKTPSGIYYPPGKMTVDLDPVKIERVVWKITRGIYFQNFKSVLPESLVHRIARFDVMPKFSEEFQNLFIKKVTTAGSHAGVLVYKYGHYNEPGNKAHVLLMRFWKTMLFRVDFHDAGCDCDPCKKGLGY